MRRAALLAVVLLAGCGSSSKPALTTGGGSDGVASLTLAIIQPDGQQVRGTRRGDQGALIARVAIAGQGTAGQTVAVSGDCRRQACAAQTKVDGDGAWRTIVELQATEARPSARVVARSGDESSLASARLRPPPVRASARTQRPATSGRRGGQDVDPGAGAGAGSSAADGPSAAPVTLPDIPAPSGSGSSADGAPKLLVIGDSLAQGTESLIGGLLQGWSVATDAERGRPLAAGMAILARHPEKVRVIAFSLFTNDGPGDVTALEAAVRTSVARQAGQGCVVWATIVRPPVGGVSYAAANAALERLESGYSGRLIVVPWAREVAANPSWLGPDGVHGTAAGYAGRAQLYADAIQSCGDA